MKSCFTIQVGNIRWTWSDREGHSGGVTTSSAPTPTTTAAPSGPARGVALTPVPVTLMALTGGVLFGAVQGSVLSVAGALLGSIGAYWIARALGRDVILRGLGRQPATSEFRFTSCGPMPVQVDGEVTDVAAGTEVRVRCSAGALSVVR